MGMHEECCKLLRGYVRVFSLLVDSTIFPDDYWEFARLLEILNEEVRAFFAKYAEDEGGEEGEITQELESAISKMFGEVCRLDIPDERWEELKKEWEKPVGKPWKDDHPLGVELAKQADLLDQRCTW